MLECQPFLSHSIKQIRGATFPEVLVARGHQGPKWSFSSILQLWQENDYLFYPTSSKYSLHQSAVNFHECRASEGLRVKAPTFSME